MSSEMIDLKCKKCKTLLVFNTKMWIRLIYCPNCNYLNVWSKDEEKLKNSKSISRSVDIKHSDLYHLNKMQ